MGLHRHISHQKNARLVENHSPKAHLLAICSLEPHLRRLDTPDPVTRLNSSLAGRYRIEREIGEGGLRPARGRR